MREGSEALSARIVAALAAAWTALLWLAWFGDNPLYLHRLWPAVREYSLIRPWPALLAGAGRIPLFAALAVFFLASRGAGRSLMRWLGGPVRGLRGELTSVAAGAGALGLAALGAGFTGCVFSSLAWALLLPAAAEGVRGLPRPSWRGISPAGWGWLPAAALAFGVWTAFVGALAPEGALDALVHHIGHPVVFIGSHKVTALPHHFLSHNPALLEMQYMLSIMLSGSTQAPKLVHFCWGLLAAAALGGWTSGRLGTNWGYAAAAAFVLVPYVQLVMMWGYLDLGVAGYLTLALWAAVPPRRGWVAAGLLAGMCAGSKMTGVFAAVLVAGLMASGGAGRREWLAAGAAFMLAAVPWGLKSFLYCGNPFAPMLPGFIPTLWWEPANQARYLRELTSHETVLGAGAGFAVGLLGYPWSVAVHRSGVLDTGGGAGGWFLWGIPLLVLAGRSGGRVPALLAAGYFAMWMFIPRQSRYLLPALPVATLAAAHAAAGLARGGGLGRLSLHGAGAALVLLAVQAQVRQYIEVNPLKYAFGLEGFRQYLNRGLPGHPWSLAAQEWARTAPGIGRYLIATEYGCGQYWGPRAVIQSSFDTSLMERFAREAPPGRIGIRFRQAGIGTVMYAATMGFVMAAEYGTFNFDGGTAGRWREFWTKNAVLVHNQDDKFLFFSLAGRPTGKESVPASSVLPGLDEQWLGMTDRTMRSADIEGWSAAALPRAAEEYRRVARSTGSPAAWERLGTSLLRMGRAAEARAALREAERRGRRSAVLFDAMGYLESRDGNAAQAAACFRRSLEFDPGLEEARRNLAVLLLDMGRREEAVRLVQEGLALDPGSMGLRELMLGISGRQ